MKQYALVSIQTRFVVIPYATWMECPNGCVMQTSDDREELEQEAEWRNVCEGWVDDISIKTKDIELTLEQQDELLNVDMTSFREASQAQSIRDTNRWWVKNFLPNAVIQRVDRISPLIYRITYYNDYVDESISIFG